ncbi:MAG: aminoglycoside phosphotransferase family protein [Candidatus Poribacteria bacterium]
MADEPNGGDAPWAELCRAACRHAGVACESVRVLTTWDRGYSWNAVYQIDGGHFVKLYGPRSMTLYLMEKELLGLLAVEGNARAPDVVAAGQASGERPYLILTCMPGETAEDSWDDIPRGDQLSIAAALGATVRALHATDPGVLADTKALPGSRREISPMNIAKNCEHIEATAELDTARAEEFTAFIRDEGAAILVETTCLVHCELTNNHIYLRHDSGTWRLSGLIDFADAMVSAPEFDIAWLWPWTFSRDGEAMRVCLAALYDGAKRPEGLARRCLAATLCSYSAEGLWDEYVLHCDGRVQPSVADMTEWLFPADVFGS